MVRLDGKQDGLARVLVVNNNGIVLIDKFVLPAEGRKFTDYRTWISGVIPESLKIENGALPFIKAKRIVHKILKDKIIVGHSLENDFRV